MPTHNTTHIPEWWRETTLGENIVEIAMWPFWSNLKVDMFTDKWVPIIKWSNLFWLYVNGDFTFVSEEKATSLWRSVAYPWDFVITHRWTLWQVALVPDNNYPRYVASQSQLRFNVDQNKIDNLYLLYFLKSSSWQYELLKNASQVWVPAIATPTKAIKDIHLLLPPLPEQRAIADMLSSLDAKIELLREQNETLEKTAQTIFHEWFGRYSVESPEELPEGWRVQKLGEVDFISFGDWNYSAKYPKQSDFVDEWIPFISNKDISNGMILSNELRYISHEQHSVLKKWHLKQWDILISTRANIWDIALVSSEFEDANINAQLVFIRTDNPEIYSNFLYIIFSSKKYRSIFESYSSWSAQAQLPMHALRQIQIIIPTQQKLMEFSWIINPLFNKMQTNNSQIQSLSKTRDTLLPKLMSGEMRVV